MYGAQCLRATQGRENASNYDHVDLWSTTQALSKFDERVDIRWKTLGLAALVPRGAPIWLSCSSQSRFDGGLHDIGSQFALAAAQFGMHSRRHRIGRSSLRDERLAHRAPTRTCKSASLLTVMSQRSPLFTVNRVECRIGRVQTGNRCCDHAASAQPYSRRL